MKFFSLKEYFYKINTIGFILLLLPVIVFLYLHAAVLKSFPVIDQQAQQYTVLVSTLVFVTVALTFVNAYWRMRIRRLRSEPELAKKMDGYFILVVLRNGTYALALLVLGAGYYYTHLIYLFGIFIVVVLLLIAQWPGPARFCMAFQLKGSERDLVLHNEDLPRKRKTKRGSNGVGS